MITKLTQIATVIAVIPIIHKATLWIHKLLTKPKITWGLSDFPSSKRVDYYIEIDSKNSLESIKLLLTTKSLQSSDYCIAITSFFSRLGHEYLQKVNIYEQNHKKCKEAIFDLPPKGLFRLTIESIDGIAGTLVPDNLEKLILEHSSAKIIYKSRKFP